MVAHASPLIGLHLDAQLPSGMQTRYVAGTGITGLTGSDSNAGLSPRTAFATIQAAYDSLDAKGGTLILLPGRHNVGTGFVGYADKYAVITSLTGYQPEKVAPVVSANVYKTTPVISGSGARLLKIGTGSGIRNGWAFLGLAFDMSTSGNLVGIHGEDVNHVRIRDCTAEATHSEQAYLTTSTQPGYDDSSWWRIEDCLVRNMGLCSLNHGGVDGNCNNNQIINNVVFGGLTAGGFAIQLALAQRCLVMGNNLEGGASIRYLGASHYNHTVFNNGEGTGTPFLQYDSGAYGNIHFNYGIHGGAATGSEVLLNDLDADNTFATGSYEFAHTASGMATLTSDFTLASSNWWGQMLDMSKASAITLTVPANATQGIQIGSTLMVRQGGAGQVTIAPAGGVTIRSKDGLKTSAQYGVINLRKVDVDLWTAWGDTTT